MIQIERKDKESLKAFWQSLSQGRFTGYIIMSDRPMEYAFTTPSELPSWEKLHRPYNFIWEANLYEENKRSISIQQFHETWQIVEIAWNGSPEKAKGEFIRHKYLMHIPSEGKQIEKTCIMQEAWHPVPDEFCENMEVLKPAWCAFVGFEKEGEKDDRL